MNLITDRTAADVERYLTLRNKGFANLTAAERTEWLSPMKGAYNYTDLNRVGTALNYVRDQLSASGYLRADAFTARTDWRSDEIPTVPAMSAYLGHVSVIREALAQFSTTPAAPTDPDSLDYVAANSIEQILIDVDELITRMRAAAYFSGDLFLGEV